MEDYETERLRVIGEKEDRELEEIAKSDEDAVVLDSKRELAELNDKYLRLAADFQNFKRRTEGERSDVVAYANERIAKELLVVMDSFHRALGSDEIEKEDVFYSGMKLIYKQLADVLKNFGVEEIQTEDQAFDPNYHDAVLSEQVDGVEAGQILDVMQKGYTLGGRVIRATMVKVSV